MYDGRAQLLRQDLLHLSARSRGPYIYLLVRIIDGKAYIPYLHPFVISLHPCGVEAGYYPKGLFPQLTRRPCRLLSVAMEDKPITNSKII